MCTERPNGQCYCPVDLFSGDFDRMQSTLQRQLEDCGSGMCQVYNKGTLVTPNEVGCVHVLVDVCAVVWWCVFVWLCEHAHVLVRVDHI